MRFVVINGAPGVGKDTLGNLVMQQLNNAGINTIHGRIKDVLYEATARRYNLIDLDHWIHICNDSELKETPMAILDGKTPRQVLQYESEEVIKVRLGIDGVVKQYVADLHTKHGEYKLRRSVIVFTDGGFQSETDYLRDNGLPWASPLITRLCRLGHSFQGDTREYLCDPKFIFLNQYSTDDLNNMASLICHEIMEDLDMPNKSFVKPKVEFRHRFRAALASAIMLREGQIKLYEVGIAYRTNLNIETRRKW